MYGDPSTPQLWGALETKIFAIHETEEGKQMRITGTCIDSGGHHTTAVYKFCKKHAGKGVFAIKGVGGDGRPLAGRPSKNNSVKCPLFPIGVDTGKDLVFARLGKKEEGGGYVHFSDTLTDEYFKQLTAEKAVTRYHKGFKKRSYVKTRERNEALDCMVYSIAAYGILNVDINTLVNRMAKEQAVEPEKTQNKSAKKPFVPRAGKNFVNSWR
jgi:phage terminase large subunit GpA-like protein